MGTEFMGCIAADFCATGKPRNKYAADFFNGGTQMTEITSGQGMLMIVLMCGVLLMIVLRGKRTEIMIGFILRALCGLVCIYVVNYVMLHFQYQGTIGVNPYTLLASGLLGLPGLIALYAIKIISLL